MAKRSERRLIVIMHADVVGSTALVRRDETLAHERILDSFRRLSKAIETYGGSTKELRGDALVGEFGRVSDAVCAAIAFQEENAEFNTPAVDEMQPGLRIGIAMGEMVVADNTVTGEGVVLAQRLEQLAERDGICLQGAAYETVPKRLPFEYESRGEHTLKGFEEPVRVFAVSRKAGESLPPPESDAPSVPVLRILDEDALPPTAGASIAVMPFANIGADVEQDYFSRGVTAEIHSDLTRFRDLFVSGRSSCDAVSQQTSDVTEIASRLGVQYVVQGTVRSHKDTVRIAAELVDGATGGVLWSERYDRALNDIFEVETEVANAIAASLSVRIEDAQYERRKDSSPDRLSAYDLLLRGNRSLELGGMENWNKARHYFTRALELEPESAAACAGLSISYGNECGELLAENYSEALDRHRELAEKAIALDESDSRGHHAMVRYHQLSGQLELADLHAARAVELNPSEFHNICSRGYTLMCLGRVEESVACFNESLRRNPFAPNSCLLAFGLMEYFGTNYGQSAIALSRMSPSYIHRVSCLAATYAQLGYEDEARAAAREFRSLAEVRPGCPTGDDTKDWQVFWRRMYPYVSQEAFEHLLEGIGKAGFPA